MAPGPNLGEMLLGIEGLALLRLASDGDSSARRARVDEIRGLLERMDHAADLAGPAGGTEYGLAEGYRLWSETMIAPSACSPSKSLSCTCCSIPFRRRSSSTRHAEPAGTAGSWPRGATGSSGSTARPRCLSGPVAMSERGSSARAA